MHENRTGRISQKCRSAQRAAVVQCYAGAPMLWSIGDLTGSVNTTVPRTDQQTGADFSALYGSDWSVVITGE